MQILITVSAISAGYETSNAGAKKLAIALKSKRDIMKDKNVVQNSI